MSDRLYVTDSETTATILVCERTRHKEHDTMDNKIVARRCVIEESTDNSRPCSKLSPPTIAWYVTHRKQIRVATVRQQRHRIEPAIPHVPKPVAGQ
jgi:hypothetical protein